MSRLKLIGTLLFVSLQIFAQDSSDKDKSLLISRDTTKVLIEGKHDLSQTKLNTSDLLKFYQPELINAMDQIPGFFKIHEAGYPLVYRGMSASRLRIERNGALRTGFVSQGYLTEDINPGNVIDLRVITGVESVLYGSGASGGVLNIKETQPAASNWQKVMASYGTNAKHKIIGFNINRGKGKLQWLFSGRIIGAEDFENGDGEAVENSARKQNQLKLSFRTALLRNTTLTWNHDWSNGNIQRPQGFQNNPFELRQYRNRYSYQSNIETLSSLNNDLIIEQNAWLVLSENDQEIGNYNGEFSYLNVFENRNYGNNSFGYRFNLSKSNPLRFQWKTGFDLIQTEMDQINTRNDYLNQVLDEVSFTQKRKSLMGGLFAMGSFEMSKIRFDLSIRGDLAQIGNEEEQVSYQVLSGGIGIDWNIYKNITQQFNVARKFRYPTQDESLGKVFGGRGIFRGNPSVKPERSFEFEWDLAGTIANKWRFNISSWLVFFKDRISEIYLENNIYTYENISKARTMGIDVRIDRAMLVNNGSQQLTLSLASSLIQGEQLNNSNWFSSGEPLVGIPSNRYTFSGRWKNNISKTLSITSSTDLEYVAAFDRLPSGTIRQTFGTQETDGYWLLNLNLEGQLNLKSQLLNVGIRITNLSNTSYYPFGARIMGMGRNFTIYTSFTF